ncbi:uncharacterized protein LOC128883355 isoform X2 [Hylaeus volcanicus]|uniref:uncharacterized protein LOC128883355 isoform X2 n=1 Tax=Hylaeus volcanicus TaxID=313075 RepID=UPI0023B828E0|nr:uncharacterized protein LOC128883355 isoform X2 [Hylaeus volcanicus]
MRFETENHKNEETSVALQASENDSDQDVDAATDRDTLEQSANGTHFDEETKFFLRYSDVEKQKGNSDDFFDINEMQKFVDQGENMDFDEESLLDETNTKLLNKEDQALDKLLDEYEENNEALSKHAQKCEEEDDDSTNANEKDFDVDDSDEDIQTLEDVYQNTKNVSKLSNVNATSTLNEQKKEESHLLDLVQKNDILDNLIDTTERELVGDKHWTMKGEVSAKSRDQNSLLEVHLDIPQYNHHYQSEDALGIHDSAWNNEESYEDQHNSLCLKNSETSCYSSLSQEIEKIVLHRIRYLLFDDVVRKYEKPVAVTGNDKNDAEAEILDFQKNQNGLAEVYADYYTKQVLDGVTQADVKLNEKCTQMSHLFNTIMYKLDALSSHRVMRKPLVHKGNIPDNVPSVTVEDTIPALVSDNQRKAPQEIFEPGTLKKREEMTQEEKKSLRRLHKARRKNKTHNLLMTGQTTLQENIKKSIDLHRKNRDEKEKKKRTKNTGVATEKTQSRLFRTKRLRTADFITNAATSI